MKLNVSRVRKIAVNIFVSRDTWQRLRIRKLNSMQPKSFDDVIKEALDSLEKYEAKK